MRNKYFVTMTGREWSCAENFHLALDTSLLPFEDIAEMVIEVLQRKRIVS